MREEAPQWSKYLPVKHTDSGLIQLGNPSSILIPSAVSGDQTWVKKRIPFYSLDLELLLGEVLRSGMCASEPVW